MSGFTTKRVYMNKRNVNIGGGVNKTGIPSSTGIPIMLRRFIHLRAPNTSPQQTTQPTFRSGSLFFNGTLNSNILIANDEDLSFGENEDFTVEWFQFQTDDNSFPRIFQIGTYASEDVRFGVSIEGGTFFLWVNGIYISSIDISDYKNAWVHFAIVRKSGTIKTYMNGVQIDVVEYGDSIDASLTDLRIGNETELNDPDASFGGYITNFRWTKGEAVYDGDNFEVPSAPLTKLAGTKILLLAEEANPFYTYKNSTTISNVVWDSKTPF